MLSFRTLNFRYLKQTSKVPIQTLAKSHLYNTTQIEGKSYVLSETLGTKCVLYSTTNPLETATTDLRVYGLRSNSVVFCSLFRPLFLLGGMLFCSGLFHSVVLFASDPGTWSGVRLHRVFQLNMIDTPFFSISKCEAKEAVYIFSRFSASSERKMWARPDGWCDLPDKGSRDLNKVRKLNISRLIMILISVKPFKQLQLICSGLYRATSKDRTAFVRVHSAAREQALWMSLCLSYI